MNNNADFSILRDVLGKIAIYEFELPNGATPDSFSQHFFTTLARNQSFAEYIGRSDIELRITGVCGKMAMPIQLKLQYRATPPQIAEWRRNNAQNTKLESTIELEQLYGDLCGWSITQYELRRFLAFLAEPHPQEFNVEFGGEKILFKFQKYE